MVTLKEVAAAAQVSTVTASSVLSGVNRVRVSPTTADRIHKVAKTLNYVPLAAARGLRTGKTRIVAFVASSGSHYRADDMWHESLRGISDVMWEREKRLMLVMSKDHDQGLETIRQMAFGRQVDGFIIQADFDDQEQIGMLRQSERPFVMMGGIPREGINSVTFDMRAFAADIAGTFLADGCGAVILVTPQNLNAPVYAPFLGYFQDWEREHHIPCINWTGAFTPDVAWLTERTAALGDKKRGIALLRGLLPEMVDLLGAINLPMGQKSSIVYVSTGEEVLMSPSGLTVMHFDNYTLGRRSARLLLNLTDRGGKGPFPTESIIIPAAQKG